jgi:hypothetical protein
MTTTIRSAVLGALVALCFALVIRVVPESLFEPKSWGLALAYVIGIVAGPPSVWLVHQVTRPAVEQRFAALFAAMLGAMTFDGIAIGFFPSLYGQDEMGSVGAFLLVAFVALGVSGWVMATPHPARP